GTRVVAPRALIRFAPFMNQFQPQLLNISSVVHHHSLTARSELKQSKYKNLKRLETDTDGSYYLAEVSGAGSGSGVTAYRGVLGFDKMANAGASTVKIQQFILPADQSSYQLYWMLDQFEREVRRLSRVNSNNISR